MSVIIRLQNLPWSANALDIRQFFRGLSIPEGGVHIVGGEMGDAFIAFSTDEDARQAMMHDREAINGVQIRLLLSSRAEMQKVIETARQQSLLALKKASGAILSQPKASPPAVVTMNIQKPIVAPQPPVITASSFQSLLSKSAATVTPSFLAYQQQAGFTLIPEPNSTATNAAASKNNNDSDESGSRHSRERHRSISRERHRSRSRSKERGIFRRRRERSRDRSRDRDWTSGRRSSRRRSRSRDKIHARSRDRSRDRSREKERSRSSRDSDRRSSRERTNPNKNKSSDSDAKTKSTIASWSMTNSYKASYNAAEVDDKSLNKLPSTLATSNKPPGLGSPTVTGVAVAAVSTTFQNYSVANQSLTALNNYSLSGILGTAGSGDSFKGFALQNPYTIAQNELALKKETDLKTTSSSAIPGIFVEKKPEETLAIESTIDSANSLPQEPIAFANVNPYEQMYPNLFAQAAALNSGQKSGASKQSSSSLSTNSPKADETGSKEIDPNETNCVKISNMCARTTYSDLRKFFVGLFIPHNGIKLLNDKHGLRIGIAYVQFSRQSSVTKALCRSNNLLRGKSVTIEAIGEQEFLEAEDSFRPPNQERSNNESDNEADESNPQANNNNGTSALNPYKKVMQMEPFTVLYIEDIPALATEQDIMKMFSSYSLYDILLIASPENRREFVAHVRFSRAEDARSAYDDRAHHQIGYRRVRVRPGSLEDMESAKEKIRLANEQLMKEEQAAEEEEFKRKEETKRKLEKLITDHLTQEELKQQNIISMDLTNDDREDDEVEKNLGVEDLTENLEDNDGDMEIIEDNYEDEQESRNNVNMQKMNLFSMQQSQGHKSNANLDPRLSQTPNIPSLFDLDPMNNGSTRNQTRPNLFNDPRLRNISDRMTASVPNNIDSSINNQTLHQAAGSNYNNLNSNEANSSTSINNTENNFVILKNCDYNTRINDVAQLLLTANLALKHIEPLRNERLLSTGEFIVEFRRRNDAEIAVKRFHNIQFRNRSLRVFPISPQEIADRLGKPFLSYIPGGNGVRMTKSMAIERLARSDLNLPNSLTAGSNNGINSRYGNTSQQNMNFDSLPRNNPFSDTGSGSNSNSKTNLNNKISKSLLPGNTGIPEKFTYPGCVLSMENVPYKAQITDILRFFQGFDLKPDDIIRRFNDDGTPTGDARVAFNTAEEARSAYEAKRRKQIFGRNIYIKIL